MLQCYWFCSLLCSILPHIPSILYPEVFLIGIKDFSEKKKKKTILRRSAFFTVQLSHTYMTTGKTIALTRWTFVGKVMILLFNMLSSLVITFLPRSKRLLISWCNHHLQ